MNVSTSAAVGSQLRRNRAPARQEPSAAPVLPAPPFRLRFVLLVALLVWGVWLAYPRMQAAFRLHDVTVATADYALCMAGPTGPSLIRDRPRDFERLVRRRLVASAPAERPFQRCAKLAHKITTSVDSERVHTLAAGEFREYGGKTATLSELAVSTADLARLSASAWPFARSGYTQLIKPSLGAAEAAHVPAPARPALGRGLPARGGVYRNVWRDGSSFGLALGGGSDTALFTTADRGVTFRQLAGRRDAVEQHAERCASQDGRKAYRLTPREDGAATLVMFSVEGAPPLTGELAPISHRVVTSACDERSLLVLTSERERERERLHLRACPFGGRCGELPLPALLSDAAPSAVDVAKVKGAIVLSAARGGVVRVVSSRDEGRSFTPAVVAYDAAEYPELGAGKPPSRLLALGERLLLYAGATKSGEAYPLLASDDQGASFRTP